MPFRPMPLAALAAAVLLASSAACGTEPTGEDHDPAAAKLFVGSTEVTPSVSLPSGAVTRIEVRYYDGAGDVISGLEAEHSAGLIFAPASLASVAPVTGQKFFFDVTAQAGPGTGSLSVGFGHGSDTDEKAFGPFAVTVQ